jgi:iron complex transport system ATP-binding protein
MKNISIENLSVKLGGKLVLDNVSLHARAGEIIAILGPNGAGKSSLLKAVLGLQAVEQGEVKVDGNIFLDLALASRAKICSYLPQAPQVHWPLQVEHLVGLARPHRPNSGVAMLEADQKAIDNALKLADADEFKGRSIFNLSGGERARVLLARALAVEAAILLADEPVAALDPRHQLEVMEVFKSLAGTSNSQAGKGKIVFVVLHDINLACRYAHKICLLDKGRLAAFDDTKTVLNSGKLEQVFGVRLKPKDGEEALVPWEVVG